MRRMPSQSHWASPVIWDHTVLPATRHKCRACPTLTPPSKLYPDLLTPEEWKAELTWQCTDRELNSRSLDHKTDVITTRLYRAAGPSLPVHYAHINEVILYVDPVLTSCPGKLSHPIHPSRLIHPWVDVMSTGDVSK